LIAVAAAAPKIFPLFEQQRGLERGQVFLQRMGVRAVPDRHSGVHGGDLDLTRKHVRQRQEKQRAGVADEQRRQALDGAGRTEEQVAVSECASLGPTGCARGVDDRGQ
jgi:hypothetical protein